MESYPQALDRFKALYLKISTALNQDNKEAIRKKKSIKYLPGNLLWRLASQLYPLNWAVTGSTLIVSRSSNHTCSIAKPSRTLSGYYTHLFSALKMLTANILSLGRRWSLTKELGIKLTSLWETGHRQQGPFLCSWIMCNFY